MAKPRRKQGHKKRGTLDARFVEATWVGFSGRSNEHVVVLKSGGPAIRVRTVRTRPPSERWNAEAVVEIIATPDTPNPKDPLQKEPRPERDTMGLDFSGRGEVKIFRSKGTNSGSRT